MFTCLSGKARFRLTLNRGKNVETTIANQFVDEVFVAWPGRKEVLVLESICHTQIRTIGKKVEIVNWRNEPWTLIMHWRNVHMNVDSKSEGAGRE